MPVSGDPSGDSSTNVLIVLGVCLAALMALSYWYDRDPGALNTPLIQYARLNAEVFQHLPWPLTREAGDCRRVLAFIAIRPPAKMTSAEVQICVSAVTAPWRWLSPLLFLPIALAAVRRYGNISRRRTIHTMRSLMAILVNRFPHLTPAVKWDFLKMGSYEDGPWRGAMYPIEWVWKHKVLYIENPDGKRSEVRRDYIFSTRNGPTSLVMRMFDGDMSPILSDPKLRASLRIDHDRARKHLVKQLGPPFTGFHSLPLHAKGLAAAFAAFAGDKAARKEGQAFLDQMSRSIGILSDNITFKVDTTGAEELWKKHHTPHMDEILQRHHSFCNVWLCGLLEHTARRRGTLAPSQFMWLRAVDRTMWYALNQLGGRRPWVEATGVWAHYECEEEIEQAILDPEIQDAVDWIVDEIRHEGWLDDPAESTSSDPGTVEEESWVQQRRPGLPDEWSK